MSVPVASVGRALPLLALTSLALLPLGQMAIAYGLVGAILVAVIGARRGRWPAVAVATMGLLLAVFALPGVPFALWPAVGVLWLSSRRWPQLCPAPGWFPPGRSSVGAWALATITVIGAAAALTAWLRSEPELGAATVQLVELGRAAPSAVVVAFIVVFAVVNPLVEEVAYRNVAYEAARAGAPAAAVVLQALAFGTLHVVGFPAGATGVGLSFLYGLMLGIIRVMTGGLRIAMIAHIATNATIAALVVLFLLPE